MRARGPAAGVRLERAELRRSNDELDAWTSACWTDAEHAAYLRVAMHALESSLTNRDLAAIGHTRAEFNARLAEVGRPTMHDVAIARAALAKLPAAVRLVLDWDEP